MSMGGCELCEKQPKQTVTFVTSLFPPGFPVFTFLLGVEQFTFLTVKTN